MKLSIQHVAYSFLLIALSAGTASAALSEGGDGGTSAGIELAGNDTAVADRLAKALDDGMQAGMNESILKRHARSATKAISPMQGSYTREGNEAALLTGDNSAERPNGRFAGYAGNGVLPESLAAAAGAHMVGSEAAVGAPAVAVSSGSSVTAGGTVIVINDQAAIPNGGNGQTPVPLPSAALLLASGLLGIPVRRGFRNC